MFLTSVLILGGSYPSAASRSTHRGQVVLGEGGGGGYRVSTGTGRPGVSIL